jgi:choline dehydrogenase-like flavoprotein
MHVDARKIPNHSVIEGDVCIIGAGAAGISMALDWANTPFKVILLEGGGFEYDDKVQDLYAGKTIGQRYFPLRSARLHMFGGTTGHWAGMCSPFDPLDFKKRDWVAESGWPINREDLDEFYARANEKAKLGPYNYDLKFWTDREPGREPLLKENDVVWNKIWQFSTTSFGIYKDDVVKAKNIHLYTYANAVDINAAENGTSISSVTVKNHAGKEHTVKAKYFVLACCSIQNARMLLASNKVATKGLGNENDLVGRYFMEHLEIKSAELWLDPPKPLSLYDWQYGVTKFYAELAIKEEIQTKHQILNGTLSFIPLEFTKLMGEKIDLWQNEDPRKSLESFLNDMRSSGAEAGKLPPESLQKSYQLMLRMEQEPNPQSRVTLDSEKDALGVPRATLNWQLSSLDKRSIRKINELVGQEVGRQGVGRLRMLEYLRDENDSAWPEFTAGGWHHMGTTRMSDDPKKGVVDKNCKVHSIANLFVAGASCYATSAAPNPTLTVIALTLRLSDHVKELAKVSKGLALHDVETGSFQDL